jgi:predicted site-specific integrase-resolvase
MRTLTYWQAAKRVRRSVVTVKRWRREGLMEMGWDERGRRVVSEGELLRCWRERMRNDPVHVARVRKGAK